MNCSPFPIHRTILIRLEKTAKIVDLGRFGMFKIFLMKLCKIVTPSGFTKKVRFLLVIGNVNL